MLSVSILIAAAMASSADADRPLLQSTTAKSIHDFGSCFTQAEERNGRAWAFMPTKRGGTFTDSGAGGAPASYWLQVRGAARGSELRLFVPARSAGSVTLTEAVSQCR
ncbi:MAG: hypothetical protein ACJ8FT_11590 [Sphingomonas sp.]